MTAMKWSMMRACQLVGSAQHEWLQSLTAPAAVRTTQGERDRERGENEKRERENSDPARYMVAFTAVGLHSYLLKLSLLLHTQYISQQAHRQRTALRSGPRQPGPCHKGHPRVRILTTAFLISSWNRKSVCVDKAHTHAHHQQPNMWILHCWGCII